MAEDKERVTHTESERETTEVRESDQPSQNENADNNEVDLSGVGSTQDVGDTNPPGNMPAGEPQNAKADENE